MNIAKRIEALERHLHPDAPDLLVAVFMVGETPTGWTGAGHTIDRLPGETDADFKGRALGELGKIFPGPIEYCRALGEMLPG
jgi:hypothetical protein